MLEHTKRLLRLNKPPKQQTIEKAEKLMDTKSKRKRLLSRAYDRIYPHDEKKSTEVNGVEYGY